MKRVARGRHSTYHSTYHSPYHSYHSPGQYALAAAAVLVAFSVVLLAVARPLAVFGALVCVVGTAALWRSMHQ